MIGLLGVGQLKTCHGGLGVGVSKITQLFLAHLRAHSPRFLLLEELFCPSDFFSLPSPGPNLACCVLPRGERRKLDWGKYITRSGQIHNECSIGLGQIQCCGSWQIHHKYNVGSGQIHNKCNAKSGQLQNKWIEANTPQLDGLVQMIITPSPMSCMNLIPKYVVTITRHSKGGSCR